MKRVALCLSIVLFFCGLLWSQSIHYLQYENPPPRPERFPVVRSVKAEKTELEKITYFYYPYWVAGWGYTFPRWDLLSRIAYFSVSVNSSGDISYNHGWPPEELISEAHSHNVKVDLVCTLFDWDGSDVHALLSSPSARTNLVRNIVSLCVDGNGDGVNLDFEMPTGADSTTLVLLVEELKDSLTEYIADGWVSVAIGAVDWRGCYRLPELADAADALFIMGYDYHWGGAPTTGPVAPFNDPTESYDVVRTVSEYTRTGRNDKFILGCPTYGFDWPCTGAERGATTTGTGDAVLYYHALEDTATYGYIWDTNASSPWFVYGSYHQTWFDDARSLSYKYGLVDATGLLGVGFWAAGYDGGRADFWDGIQDSFGTGPTPPTDTIVIDDLDPGYSIFGSWAESSSGYENHYLWTSTIYQGDSSTWCPYIPEEGEYLIYTYYVSGTNRASNAKYRIHYADGEVDSLDVNQSINGRSWVYLGRYRFAPGSRNYITVTDEGAETGKVVVSDAVMLIRATPVGIEEKIAESRVKIFPNPFNSQLTIDAEEKVLSVEIFNIMGERIWSEEEPGNHTVWKPSTNIPAGTYLIRIRTDRDQKNLKAIYLK